MDGQQSCYLCCCRASTPSKNEAYWHQVPVLQREHQEWNSAQRVGSIGDQLGGHDVQGSRKKSVWTTVPFRDGWRSYSQSTEFGENDGRGHPTMSPLFEV